MSPNMPIVKVIVNCKNGALTIRRCLEAALTQTYPFTEILFQDGGSTDGTLDIVQEYIQKNPEKIKLYPEPDTCAGEGFYRALKNACALNGCTDDTVFVVSNADEELLPDAAAWGVEQLRNKPEAGAVYGDVYVTDTEGNITSTWIARPFSLMSYIRREVDPPLAAGFFRRKALVSAGILTRNWNWPTHEYELWLRIALLFPIYYIPGLVAKYTFNTSTISYSEFFDHDRYIAIRQDFIERFFSEKNLPESIKGMKQEAIAGLHLFIGETLHSLNGFEPAEKHLQKALELIPNGQRVVDLARKMSTAGLDLKTYIRSYLNRLLPSRIVCYGAGNDFMELIHSGIFDNHTVVAVVDNFRRQGETVSQVSIISESDLDRIDHDVVVVTSSKWAHILRTAAMQRSIKNQRFIPVI